MSSKQILVHVQTQSLATSQDLELSAKLFTALRELRKRLSISLGKDFVPYTIYSNATMQAISKMIPRNKEELLEISGIDNVTMTKYGDLILETIESTISEYYNLEGHNTSNKDAATIFGSRMLRDLAIPCKKKSNAARAGSNQQTPMDPPQTEVAPGVNKEELSLELYNALRQLRTKLAKLAGDGFMAYHIFTNATLQAISQRIPQKREDLLEINGIGNVKVAKYGDSILETVESTIREYYNRVGVNTSNESSNSSKGSQESLSADTIAGARMLRDLANPCKKKSDVAEAETEDPTPTKSTTPPLDHETPVETHVASGRKRKRKNAEALDDCERFLVSSPPVSEAMDVMTRIPPEAVTALSHLSCKRTRLEAMRSFTLSTYHAVNLALSHEGLEINNSHLQAQVNELTQENNELKGENENLKSALLEKDILMAKTKRDLEEREVKLKEQLRKAEETHVKNMAEARDAWKKEFGAGLSRWVEDWRETNASGTFMSP